MNKDDHNQDALPREVPNNAVVGQDSRAGVIAYFAYNPVAANLLMWFIIILGVVSYLTIQRQMFPNIELNMIHIHAAYPGASPQEIEESILIKVEESLKDVTEIDRIVSHANRNSGTVLLEVDVDADLTETLDRVKLRLDGIATFPADMEPLTVYQVEFQQDVIEMVLTGDVPLNDLKPVAKMLEDELLALSEVALVEGYYPDDEISVEISPEMLREYGLTLGEVSTAIAAYSTNMSAGQLQSDAGVISVRVQNQYYNGEQFRRIPVKITRDGGRVLLGDIATIVDSFVEGEHHYKYNEKNTIYLSVKATKDQNMVTVAEQVKAWLTERQKTLPSGLALQILVDTTYYLNGRLYMMKKNLLMGAVLVGLMLTLFLRLKVALWVMVGLPVCFLGAVTFMQVFGITLNIISLFGFIMVLGIVVDDAIVIGESAYAEIEKHGPGVRNVVMGARRVATPATFGVLTTIAVFAPFAFAKGPESAFFVGIAVVVMLCLVFSLVESKLILPAHLAHARFEPLKPGSWRERFNARFLHLVNHHYRRFLASCLRMRWLVLSVFVGLLVVTVSLITANHVRFVPSPPVPHDFPMIHIEMHDNVSDQAVVDALVAIDAMVMTVEREMIDEHGQGMIRDRLVVNTERTKGLVLAALVDEEDRLSDAFDMSRRSRERIPDIAGLKSLSIIDDVTMNPDDEGEFSYLLTGRDTETLNAAGREFALALARQAGVFDVSSSIDPVGKEVQLALLPVAYELGLSLRDVAAQMGLSYYGGEAQRLIRDGEEVKVMVRYPEQLRHTYGSLKQALITTPTGDKVFLGDVAELIEKPGVNAIRREDGKVSVFVYGSIDEAMLEPSELERRVNDTLIPDMQAAYPGLAFSLGGSLADQNVQSTEQILFFIAGLLMVFILLAVPLKSYSQPLIIMSIIPFSLTGAVWGHFLLGMDLSMMSTFGIIAAAGVVINDSLVMTDYVNQLRRRGVDTTQAVIDAGCARFRPVLLTSITTFCGVTPIMFESSLQAHFVIPMAVSLGFAVLFATLITLILVPCLYVLMSDAKQLLTWRKRDKAESVASVR
ncbi:MAG TPA: acriflavin resistance protein [Gammaproteobacteria bacterium]|nr:acriflavin resistance protein [Gammaproteobacteria bacterium]